MPKMRLGVRLWRERGTKGKKVPRWGRGVVPHPSVIPNPDRVADAPRRESIPGAGPLTLLKVRLRREVTRRVEWGGHVCQSVALILPHIHERNQPLVHTPSTGKT